MNSSFIILLLKKDPGLQNEDMMVKKVERLAYLTPDSFGFETTKHKSNAYFLLM